MNPPLTRPMENTPMTEPILIYEGTSAVKSIIAPHSHVWGQLNCIGTGIGSFSCGGNRLVGLPGIGIWFPPHVEHECFNYQHMQFRVINIAPEFCHKLPSFPCMLGLTDIFMAIWEDFFTRRISLPENDEDRRLAYVLIDQLQKSPAQHYFLPVTNDPLLQPILNYLEQHPDDNSSLSQWASKVFATERTIARRFTSTLGMSFREWRLRLRFLHAMALLNQGITIESVALSVGYSTSSAFISMFKKFAGISPERYRKGQQDLLLNKTS